MTQLSWKRHLALAAIVIAPALTAGGAALAMPADRAAPTTAQVQKATGLFVKATELYKAKKYSAALEEFRASYALVPSPNSHLYIARCLSFSGDTREAWIELDRTAAEAAAGGAKYVPTHDSAVAERDELGAKLSFVTVAAPNADPALSIRIAGRDVPSDRVGKPYPVTPGPVEVIVQAPGKPPLRQTVTVASGERRDVDLNGPVAAAPAGPPPDVPVVVVKKGVSPLRIGAFVAGGVGVVGFALFAAGGVLSSGTYSDLKTLCMNQEGCPNGNRALANQKISSGNTQQTLADVGLGIGIAGLAAGAALFVVSTRRAPSDASQPTAGLVVGPSWIGAQGSF
jgi:hypothetical protein